MLNADAMVRGKSIELGYVTVDQIWLIRMNHIESGMPTISGLIIYRESKNVICMPKF